MIFELRDDEYEFLKAGGRCGYCKHLNNLHNSHCCSFCTVLNCDCDAYPGQVPEEEKGSGL